MDLRIQKSDNLQGSIDVPASKFHSFRALIFAALAEGESKITKPKISSDWTKGVEALRMYGAEIKQEGDVWMIKGVGGNLQEPSVEIDCGNSGSLLFFLAGVAAGCQGESILTGDKSIRHIRDSEPTIKAINDLGGKAESINDDGRAPLRIKGRLAGGRTKIHGKASQPVTGVLIGCALASGNSEVQVIEPGELPYIDLTLSYFDKVGVEYKNVGGKYDNYTIKGRAKIKPLEMEMPKDWSVATYPVLAAVITPGSEITLAGLDQRDPHGDKEIITILQRMGANVAFTDGQLTAKYSKLQGQEIDCGNVPDQIMTLAVAGAYAEGTTKLYNAEVCRHKECDRIAVTAELLGKMGVKVEEQPDGLIIQGGGKLQGAEINSNKDHRMVMAFSVAGLQAEGETIIKGAGCVEKTFTSYIEQMKKIGAKLNKNNT